VICTTQLCTSGVIVTTARACRQASHISIAVPIDASGT
jgi:hypothetical protein